MVRTVEIDDPGPLLALLPRDDNVAWIHHDDGLVGWGRAAAFTTSGPRRFADATAWWREITRHSVVRDEVDVPGTGLVAFGTFTFSDARTQSVASGLVVPEVVVGRRDGRSWVTVVGAGITTPPSIRATDEPRFPGEVDYSDGPIDPDTWQDIVADAVGRISDGGLDKVVLARDLVATLDEPLDVRAPLARLAAD